MKTSKRKYTWRKPSLRDRVIRSMRPLSSAVLIAALIIGGLYMIGEFRPNHLYANRVDASGALSQDQVGDPLDTSGQEGTGSGAAGSLTPHYVTTATPPAALQAGQIGTFSASFSAPQSDSNVIIDAEIYNAANQKVGQYIQMNQTLAVVPTSYSWNWTASEAGTYTVKLGVFAANWTRAETWNNNAASFVVSAAHTQLSAKAATTTTSSGVPSWAALPFYTDPTNDATSYATANPGALNIGLIAREGQTPVADWFGGWDTDVAGSVNSYVSAAAAVHAMPIVVLYNIPDRDCGGYSAGGAANATAYSQWIAAASSGIGMNQAVVILEPDALASLDCLSAADQQTRLGEISSAVATLKSNSNTHVYIDGGHVGWQSATTMASRLNAAGIAGADGFSLNVSNFTDTADNEHYGQQISQQTGNKHFLIDTSRNGVGADAAGDWCNPNGMALGSVPTTQTGDPLVDALIWVKGPWGSDGPCNGGPAAGQDFWTYAVSLAENAGW